MIATHSLTLAKMLKEKFKVNKLNDFHVLIVNESDGPWKRIVDDVYLTAIEDDVKFLFLELPYAKEEFDKVHIFLEMAKRLKSKLSIKIIFAIDENNKSGIAELHQAINQEIIDKYLIFCSYKDKVAPVLKEIQMYKEI